MRDWDHDAEFRDFLRRWREDSETYRVQTMLFVRLNFFGIT